MFFTLQSYKKFSAFVNNKKNFYIVFFSLIIFLSLLKLPPVFSTDIQPWDEGMYAARVLSIEKFGDFLDQSEHSVGKFYSSTHPPLLIWAGYFVSKVTGLNAVTLKLIVYFFAVLCLLYLMKTGELLGSIEGGFLAALLFSSNIIFNIFSKRFQFDIPYTFFVILSLYFFIKYLDVKTKKYLLFCGIAAGLCLLSKLLVGMLIPMVLFAAYFVIRKESGYSFKDFVLITCIALAISLPWYFYLIYNSGYDALKYIVDFHLYQRAAVGIEQNAKGTGYFYFINYFLTIIPFGFLAFFSLYHFIANYKSTNWKIKLILCWFTVAFFIVTMFKTKLESYSFMFLPAGCLMISLVIFRLKQASKKEKMLILTLFVFNLLWYLTEYYRTNLKQFLSEGIGHKLELAGIILGVFVISFLIIKFISNRIYLPSFFTSLIAVVFIISNFNFLINIPYWENGYKISGIKKIIDAQKEKGIVYVASNYRHNPQLSFYFNGADINWGKEISGYNFKMLDIKNGMDSVKTNLQSLDKNYFIIIEKDNINRSEYPDSKLFVPENFVLLSKTSGYELYKNF
ncbi:MAG: glycosyltransferase family 39 protein [Bacteroidetes bacterium]|nr:glycosyltransferase family 39 protein [Bacteroidota bacterium]